MTEYSNSDFLASAERNRKKRLNQDNDFKPPADVKRKIYFQSSLDVQALERAKAHNKDLRNYFNERKRG